MLPLVFPNLEEVDSVPVLAEGEVLPVRWSAEMLVELDWRRLVEIARAMAVFAGLEPGATSVSPDGSAEFEMKQGRGRQALRVRVRHAPWDRWMATGACLERFAQSLAGERGLRGIYLAPGGFSPSAQLSGQQYGIELVDAVMLAARLNELPQEHSQFFFDMATSGAASVPTCPMCLRKLSQREEEPEGPVDYGTLPDLSYSVSDIVAGPVIVRRLEVRRDCEVHFLSEVWAKDIVVHGVAVGSFVCDGSLLLNPGAVLCGAVAARSVLVRPGGELRGKARIVQGTPEPLERTLRFWTWRCFNLPPKPGCEAIVFAPH